MGEGHVICTACLVESTCSTPVRRPDRRCCWHYLQVLHTGATGTSAGRSRGTCELRAVQGQPSREAWGACRSLQLGAVQARCVPLLSRLVLSLPRNHLAVIARLLLDLRFWIGAKPPQGKKGRERRLVLVLAPVLVLGPPLAPSHFFSLPRLVWPAWAAVLPCRWRCRYRYRYRRCEAEAAAAATRWAGDGKYQRLCLGL
jgi:hypothetical protein